MSNNDFGLNLNQFLAVIMLYKIRIKQDLYDTDDELLREIDLAMYCYGNHLAMTYENIEDIQIGDFRGDIATVLVSLGMYIPMQPTFTFSPSNLNLLMRKQATSSKETKEEIEQQQRKWRLKEWNRRRMKINEMAFDRAIYNEEKDSDKEEEQQKSFESFGGSDEVSDECSDEIEVPLEVNEEDKALIN